MTLALAIVLFLVICNGFFALSEMSVVTSRKARLKQQAQESRRARAALELAEHPERFLSTVQVGITSIGILTGLYGGESIGNRVAEALGPLGLDADLTQGIGTGVAPEAFSLGRATRVDKSRGIYQDFCASTMPAGVDLSGLKVVIDCANGVEAQTERLMEVCRMRKTPVIIFINKMDRDGKNRYDLLEEIEKELKIHLHPMTWPINSGKDFKGVYDLDKKSLVLEKLKAIRWGNTITLNHQKLSDELLSLEELSRNQQPASQIRLHQTAIAKLADKPDLASAMQAILEMPNEDSWLTKAKTSLQYGSPITAHIVYRLLQLGQSKILADSFRLELGLSVQCGKLGEFTEGVRALLIDKDQKPQWLYPDVASVPAAVIDELFRSPWAANEHPLRDLGQTDN